jgi:hypothetical protein
MVIGSGITFRVGVLLRSEQTAFLGINNKHANHVPSDCQYTFQIVKGLITAFHAVTYEAIIAPVALGAKSPGVSYNLHSQRPSALLSHLTPYHDKGYEV